MIITKPKPEDHNPYFSNYINLVPSEKLYEELIRNLESTTSLLSGLSEEQGNYRYAEGKWSIKELLGHIIDCERIFNYRALSFARNDQTELPGFDHDSYVKHSKSDNRLLTDMLEELKLVRHSSIALFQSLDESVWDNKGVANGGKLTVRACAYIICGHELHHINILKERYLEPIES